MSAPGADRPASLSRHARGCAWVAALTLILSTLGCGVLGLWQGVAEAIEPYWTLQLYGLLTHSKAGIEVALGPESIITLYREPRPHVGKIAALQKGLIWRVAGQTLVEEGYGFGAPIIEVRGQAYNSRTATIYFDPSAAAYHLRKVYVMDTIDTPARLLRRKYRPVEPIGEVAVDYVVLPDGVIEIQVDFSGLTAPWDRAYLMNEQGARQFTAYHDDSGLALQGAELGIWQQTPASEACFVSDQAGAQFCVLPGPGGALLFGRERYLQWNWRGVYSLSWAGVDIALDGPRDTYQYRLQLEGRRSLRVDAPTRGVGAGAAAGDWRCAALLALGRTGAGGRRGLLLALVAPSGPVVL